MAQHRAEAEAEAGVAEKMMSKTDSQELEASGQVAHAGCAEGHIFRESAPTWAKVDGHRGDQDNGTLGFLSQTKENAKERAKAKENKERATKEKERANCPDLVSIHPGDRHLATCRTGTRTVTRQS